MVKRLTVTLDDDIFEALEVIAAEQDRTVANLLAFLGREEVKKYQEKQQKEDKEIEL